MRGTAGKPEKARNADFMGRSEPTERKMKTVTLDVLSLAEIARRCGLAPKTTLGRLKHFGIEPDFKLIIGRRNVTVYLLSNWNKISAAVTQPYKPNLHE
jgi:hypothetical protein